MSTGTWSKTSLPKGLIQADTPYLREVMVILSHVFVGYLYFSYRIQNQSRQARMTAHLLPPGLLLKISKVIGSEFLGGEADPPRCRSRSTRSPRKSTSITS
ncbi:hypothetical protein MchiMG62_18210 [Methanoculleus chikugoensis]|uniref:Uncharacterized protein n=2 Tax=Methanoculleus chikugoensis TaxID=118126 RepID=A0ABM7H7N1_9EURY|nr:hypothetical protein MchiMG62_18210 [Methanoculleus chikugoensis]